MARKPTAGHADQDQLTTWVPTEWASTIDDEVDRLDGEFEGRKVTRSDVVRSALVAYFGDSEIRRETHFMRARNEAALGS